MYRHLPTFRFSGTTLNDAAYLAFCNIVLDMERYNISTTGELEFSLREWTRGCDRKTYDFVGKIEPIQNYKIHIHCGTCAMSPRKKNEETPTHYHIYDAMCEGNRYVICEKLFVIKSLDNNETTSYLFST